LSSTSGPNWRLEIDDACIAWLYLDCQDADTNSLSLPVLRDLGRALDELEARSGLEGLVILSAKEAGFVVGPCATELKRLDDEGHVEQYVRCGRAVTDRLAGSPIPSVASIHGPCLGSGLELALACQYRLADQRTAALGFPDIRVGLHPCHGGTVRLPSLIGDWRALELLRRGGSVTANRAEKLGLVDASVTRDSLIERARTLIGTDPGRHRPAVWTRVFRAFPVRWFLYKLLDHEMQRESCPEKYFASYALLRLWRDHAGRPMAERLEAERQSLLTLIRQPASRNLARTYLLQDRLRNEALSLNVHPPLAVHVFGGGTIGGGVAALLVLHGRHVTVHDPDERALAAAEARIRALIEEQLNHTAEPTDALAGLQTAAGFGEPAGAELVIEAIEEDADAKRALLRKLEAAVSPNAVIATATSTLPVDELCRDMERPERLIGLHFFHPVESQPLVEVAGGKRSSEAAVSAGLKLISVMNKLPLRVRGAPGLLVTRLQLPYMLQGAAMYQRPRREVIDSAGLKFGMPHGPLELADAVGLDACQRLAEQLGYAVPGPLGERVKAGQLGQKTGKGFHDWTRGRRITTSVPPGRHAFDQIARELIQPVLREAERCRDEEVVADADLVDAGALFGVGFPAHTGGPLHLLRQRTDWLRTPTLQATR